MQSHVARCIVTQCNLFRIALHCILTCVISTFFVASVVVIAAIISVVVVVVDFDVDSKSTRPSLHRKMEAPLRK
jgi:hypothetical protein